MWLSLRGLTQVHFVEHQSFLGRNHDHIRHIEHRRIRQRRIMAHIKIKKSVQRPHRRHGIGIQSQRPQNLRILFRFLVVARQRNPRDPSRLRRSRPARMRDQCRHVVGGEPINVLMAPVPQVHFQLNRIEVQLNGMVGSVVKKYLDRQNSHIQRIRFAEFVLAALLIRPRVGRDRQSIMIIVRQGGGRVRRSLLHFARGSLVLCAQASYGCASANERHQNDGEKKRIHMR